MNTTQISGSMGALVWSLWEFGYTKKWSLAAFVSGGISGLVAITPGCVSFTPNPTSIVSHPHTLTQDCCRVTLDFPPPFSSGFVALQFASLPLVLSIQPSLDVSSSATLPTSSDVIVSVESWVIF
jgi:hypothetical protein